MRWRDLDPFRNRKVEIQAAKDADRAARIARLNPQGDRLFYRGWEQNSVIRDSRRSAQQRGQQLFNTTGYNPYNPLQHTPNMEDGRN